MLKERLVIGGAAGSVLIAQELFSLPEWAKLSVSMACLLVLAYVVIRTIPSLFQSQIEAQNEQRRHHAETIDKVCTVHRETTAEVCRKIDEQSRAQSEAIRHQTDVLQHALTSGKKSPPVKRRKPNG